MANYEKVVLNALKEVENYLSLDKQLARREYKSAYDNYKIS